MQVRPRFSLFIFISLVLLVPLYLLADPVRISAERLQLWVDGTDPPLVLDVRGKESYQKGTLPGAVNAGRDPLGYLPGNGKEPVVLVVPRAADSRFIEAWRHRLADAGHKVWILDSGFDAWKALGGTVVTPDVIYTEPGRVPFVIPKGLCERNDPAHIYK